MRQHRAFYRAQLIKNLCKLHRMMSFWIVAIASAAAAYWLQLDKAAQDELISQYPTLAKLGPLITLVAWVFARIIPQKSVTPPPEDPK